MPGYSPDGRALVSTSRLGLHPGPSADEQVKSLVMKIYGCPTKRPTPSFKQIAKYEIENALPNMAPPWPPISANTESPKATAPTESKIVFAGDYTVNGSIEGALQSGLTAAKSLLDLT